MWCKILIPTTSFNNENMPELRWLMQQHYANNVEYSFGSVNGSDNDIFVSILADDEHDLYIITAEFSWEFNAVDSSLDVALLNNGVLIDNVIRSLGSGASYYPIYGYHKFANKGIKIESGNRVQMLFIGTNVASGNINGTIIVLKVPVGEKP